MSPFHGDSDGTRNTRQSQLGSLNECGIVWERSRSMDQPTAEQALAALEPLVGEWSLEAIGADNEPGQVAEASASSGTRRAHICYSVRPSTIPMHPTASASDAMPPTERTSSCTPTSAASAASTR